MVEKPRIYKGEYISESLCRFMFFSYPSSSWKALSTELVDSLELLD